MFYTLRVRARNNSFLKRAVRKTKKIIGVKDASSDFFDNAALVKKYTPGKSFADIGCMWGVDGFFSFLAEENGAAKVMSVDIYPESAKFSEEKERRNSKIQFVQGDINLPDVTDTIGICDVVFCSGVLYHTPDPVHMLTRLRVICGETLILNTASIPEMPGIRNAAVFYPFLNAKQRKIWNRHIGSQKGITGPYEPESGYGNWMWGMTPSAIESMLQCAGFKVQERYISPFRSVFVCKTIPIQFVAESGEWTTPKSGDSLKFRK
ncbi:MAG: methyltransferase domain-containing protein [Candidatus Sungbacteria bacterium]|nr:methyltransferase domain-containing protein [Candidatus Sungbacteria bacterium]